MTESPSPSLERRAILIRGVVQGVGFRPFVFGLATQFQLAGFVRNAGGSVVLEVEGDSRMLDCFLEQLQAQPPPLACIEEMTWTPRPVQGDRRFQILASDLASAGPILVAADIATCGDCLAELLDPGDRRFGYPFLNCTNCGPRLTILTGAPYDRARTTMAMFLLCPACRAEYEDPTNRRFHAQPTCCADCGPHLSLLGDRGEQIPAEDPLAAFTAALRAGKIGALRGLGGFHLACDARSPEAVALLRRRKHRDEKPFALMVTDVESATNYCEIDGAERNLLESRSAPIVLLRKRPGLDLAEGVAPDNPWLGVMLPYTPLHHLLLRMLGGMPLVLTSGNRSDEPIAYETADALERLTGIADVFLTHDRPIRVRCEDSVTRCVMGEELPIRRSRGHAPLPLPLPVECPLLILAVGGQLKGTFALGRGREAILSHHLGDLDQFDAYQAFVRDIGLYEDLFAFAPGLLVHDMHPDYASTRYALARSGASLDRPLPILAVQHHHAHMAACMAEHGLDEPVLGVSFDGTGYGTDGAIWGGEFLIGDYREFRRAAHLRYVGMPGGAAAIREPWRMALAHLEDAGIPGDMPGSSVPLDRVKMVRRMLERRLNTPLTSSAGRLFDAVAALAGVRETVSYEGQAAVELERLAETVEPAGAYPFQVARPRGDHPLASLQVDTRPLLVAILDDVRAGTTSAVMARRFHTTMVDLIREVCVRLRETGGPDVAVLSGGVFLNALLTRETTTALRDNGFRVHRHRRVPPNDGGLCLGQVAIAARSWNRASPG